MNDILLQQIEKIPIVKLNKNLFRATCGIELEFLNPDGVAVSELSAPKSKNPIAIKPEILKVACENQEPQIYLCPAGLTMILVPIVLKEETIGVVYTGESATSRFVPQQAGKIIKLLKEFLDYVLQNELHPIILNVYEGNSITRQQELLDRVVSYVKKNYHNNSLTLKEVSENNGISYHYLSRLFKKELKTSFGQFRNQIRMEAATKMLKNHRLSVSQISYACGFDDPAYFCKVFRGTHGTSPLGFRQKEKPARAKNYHTKSNLSIV